MAKNVVEPKDMSKMADLELVLALTNSVKQWGSCVTVKGNEYTVNTKEFGKVIIEFWKSGDALLYLNETKDKSRYINGDKNDNCADKRVVSALGELKSVFDKVAKNSLAFVSEKTLLRKLRKDAKRGYVSDTTNAENGNQYELTMRNVYSIQFGSEKVTVTANQINGSKDIFNTFGNMFPVLRLECVLRANAKFNKLKLVNSVFNALGNSDVDVVANSREALANDFTVTSNGMKTTVKYDDYNEQVTFCDDVRGTHTFGKKSIYAWWHAGVLRRDLAARVKVQHEKDER